MTRRCYVTFCAVLLLSVFVCCSNDKATGPSIPETSGTLFGSWQSVSFDTNGVNVPDEIIILSFESDSTVEVLHFTDNVVNTGNFNWDKIGSTLTLTPIEGTFLATNLLCSLDHDLLTLTGKIDGTDTSVSIVLKRYTWAAANLHGLWVNEANGESPYRADVRLILPDQTGIRLKIWWEAQQSGGEIIFSSLSIMRHPMYIWSVNGDTIFFDTPLNDYSREFIATDSTLVMYIYDPYYSLYRYTVYDKGNTELDWGDNGGTVYKIGPHTVTFPVNLRNTDYYCFVDEIYAIWLSPAGGDDIDITVLGNPREATAAVMRTE